MDSISTYRNISGKAFTENYESEFLNSQHYIKMNTLNASKRNTILGIVSMLLMLTSFGIGVASIAPYSIALSLIALLITIVAISTISGIYCSKCTCRDNCIHYLFGKISVLLSKKNPEQYNSFDLIVGVVLPMGMAIAFPQYWLFKNTTLLISYWILLAIAGLDVSIFVCNKCKNVKCSMCKNSLVRQADVKA
jgi:hypothetical protein